MNKAAAGTQTEPATVKATGDKAARKTAKRAHKGRTKARVTASKSKPAWKASRPRKEASAGSSEPAASRTGSKSAQILDLLEREGGATLADLMSATAWQPHSVRAFLSTLRKRRNVAVAKGADGVRTYSIQP